MPALALALAAVKPCGSNCRAQMLAVVKEEGVKSVSGEAKEEAVESEGGMEERWCRGWRG